MATPPQLKFDGYITQPGQLTNSPALNSQQVSQGFNAQGQPTTFTTNYKVTPGTGQRQLTPEELRQQLPNFKGTQLLEKGAVGAGLVGGAVVVGTAAPAAAVVVPASLGIAASLVLSDIGKEVKRALATDTKLPALGKSEREILKTKEYEAIAKEGYKGFERQLQGGNFVDNFVTAFPGSILVDDRTRRLFFDAAWSKARELGYTEAEANELANVALKFDAYPGQIGEVGSALYNEIISNKVGEVVASRLPVDKGLKTIVNPETGKVAFDVSKVPVQNLRSLSPIDIGPVNIFGRNLQVLGNPVANLGVRSAAVAGFLEGGSGALAYDISRNQFGDQGNEAQVARVLASAGLGGLTAAGVQNFTFGAQLGNPKLSKFAQVYGYAADPEELPGDIASDVLDRFTRRGGAEFTNIPSEFRNLASRQPLKIRVSTTASTLANTLTNTASDTLAKTNALLNSQTQVQSQTQAQTNAQTAAQTKTKTQTQAQTNAQTQAQTNAFVPTDTFNFTDAFASTDASTETKTDAETQAQTDAQTQAETQAETQAQTQAETNANTATDTSALTTVSATTPRGGGLPFPLPPLFGFPTNGGGRTRQGRVFYFDELGQAQRLLNSLLLGGNIRYRRPVPRRVVKRRRKR